MTKCPALLFAALIFSAAALLVGCEEEYRQYEDYHLASLADLSLTAANHPHGYTRSECFVCHNPGNIHQVNRLGAPNFDLAAPIVKESGLASCSGCHGNNGVLP